MDIKRFDIYRKVPKDLTQPTFTGALISIGCVFFILFLLISELSSFIAGTVTSELYVSDPDRTTQIPVELDISLPYLGCEYIGLDIQDEMGRHEVGHMDNAVREPLSGGGCRFHVKFAVAKVPGNFHVSTHSAQSQPSNPDMRHTINKVIFGEDMKTRSHHGSFNSLQDTAAEDVQALASHDYILKVVPSIYEESSGQKTYSYQYTSAHKEYVNYHHSGQIIPAIWFRYELSPITVKYTEKRQPLYSFLTTVCAIVGGTFTVAGILDSLIFSASEMYKKFEIGKLS